MNKIILFRAKCSGKDIDITFLKEQDRTSPHPEIFDMVKTVYRSSGLNDLELSLETNKEGKLSAGIRFTKDTREKTSQFDMSITTWSAFSADKDGNTWEQYGFCGDINYRCIKTQWDEYFTGNDPECIFFQELKKKGICPEELVLEREYIVHTGFDKMSVPKLVELAESMCEENPLLHPGFQAYETNFRKNIESVTTVHIGKKLHDKLSMLYEQVKESTDETGPFLTSCFVLSCWSRSISVIKAASFYLEKTTQKT